MDGSQNQSQNQYDQLRSEIAKRGHDTAPSEARRAQHHLLGQSSAEKCTICVQPAHPALKSEYNLVTYSFCREECRTTFRAAPDRYTVRQ
jgi:YHS domain-containing protein